MAGPPTLPPVTARGFGKQHPPRVFVLGSGAYYYYAVCQGMEARKGSNVLGRGTHTRTLSKNGIVSHCPHPRVLSPPRVIS
mgnify:CR=1 FL=1